MALEHEAFSERIIGAAIVELKAIKHLEDIHFAVARSYLLAVGREHGLLLNFAETTLEAKRVIAF